MDRRTDSDVPDEELVEQARTGHVRALDVLLDRHQAKVLRVLAYLGIPAQDREDVAQEVFIRVFRHLGSYRRGQPFGGWLYRVTVNAAHDHRGRRERLARDEASWTEATESVDPGPDPRALAQQQELVRELSRSMEALSERERAVFVLKEIEGLETREVARILGVATITVRRHLALARRRLRKILEPDEKEKKTALDIERAAPDGSSHH